MNVRTATTAVPASIRHRLPPTVRLRWQHRVCLTRAYRLGKSEAFWIFLCLLREQLYSPITLRRQIMGQLDYLEVAGPEAIEIAENEWFYQEFLGRADACRACLRWIDFDGLTSAALDRRIARALSAAWPCDYRQYRRRWQDLAREHPVECASVCCLQLRSWYEYVDALHAEMYRTRRTGAPASERQQLLEVLLLHRPGEPTPHAD